MSDQSERDPDVLTTGELAGRLGLHTQTIRRLASDGIIPGLKTGKDWRFSWSAIEETMRRPHPTRGTADADTKPDQADK